MCSFPNRVQNFSNWWQVIPSWVSDAANWVWSFLKQENAAPDWVSAFPDIGMDFPLCSSREEQLEDSFPNWGYNFPNWVQRFTNQENAEPNWV